MKWKKLGQIFDPTQHKLPNDCQKYAQSPQALVLEDRVRIYFSTRSIDSLNGKFLSRIAFVDMDKKLQNVLQVSKKEVIALGELGCFDEHGIFPFSVFQDEGKILAYTCGWSRRQSVSVETSTGYAISEDNGVSFQKLGKGSVFGISLHEPFLVGDSFVRKYNGKYHMWYMHGVRWIKENESAAPDRVYKIGHALSDNGINWQPQERDIISHILHENECQALPTIIHIKNTYHMFFCYRDVFGFRIDSAKAYRLGHATSTDLKNWIRQEVPEGLEISRNGWDSEMMCYPNVFEMDRHIYLLYNGNNFGKHGFGAAILEDEDA